MNKLFTKIHLVGALALFAIAASAQDLSVRMVSADSLVSVIRNKCSQKAYLAAGYKDASFYSVSASNPEEFIKSALAKFKANGYTVTRYNDVLYILQGRALQTSLPTGWFSKGAKEAVASTTEEVSQTASLLNKVYEIGEERNARSGIATIRGKVRDAASGEPVVGITVSDKNGKYTMTDSYGDWTLQVHTGRNVSVYADPPLQIQYDGELPGLTTPFKARVLDGAARFIMSGAGYEFFTREK